MKCPASVWHLELASGLTIRSWQHWPVLAWQPVLALVLGWASVTAVESSRVECKSCGARIGDGVSEA